MASTNTSTSSPRRSARTSGNSGTAPLPTAHLVHAVVDRSGSMDSMGNAPPEQMRRQMTQLKSEAEKTGVSTHMTVVTFDDVSEVFMDDVLLNENNSLPSFS